MDFAVFPSSSDLLRNGGFFWQFVPSALGKLGAEGPVLGQSFGPFSGVGLGGQNSSVQLEHINPSGAGGRSPLVIVKVTINHVDPAGSFLAWIIRQSRVLFYLTF